jgi:hypothetical protein
VSYQTGEDTAGRYFKSYAFAEQGKPSLQWREIKAEDLTIGLQWDISKIIRKPGKLILSSAEAGDNTAGSVSDCENAGEDSGTGYAVYTITSIAPNPASIGRDMIVYRDTDAYIDIGAGNEWSKDGFLWHPADANGPDGEDSAEKWCRTALSTVRQTIYVRGAGQADDADRIVLPSLRSVRVNIPAMPRAPKVNIYLAQGFLSVRGGMEISNDGKTWARMTANTMLLGAAAELPASIPGNGAVLIDLNDGQDIYIRRMADNGRPPSDAFEARIKLRDTGRVTEEHFTAVPNMTLLVDNSVVLEAFIDGRWRKTKSIAARSIPANGLKVRSAGTRDRMHGPEAILRLDSHGESRSFTVTET